MLSQSDKAQKTASTNTAFRLFDRNKDGFITKDEFNKVHVDVFSFLTFTITLSLPTDHFIDRKHTQNIIKIKYHLLQVSKNLSSEQIDSVFEIFDENKDGKLSKQEFKHLMATKKWSINI